MTQKNKSVTPFQSQPVEPVHHPKPLVDERGEPVIPDELDDPDLLPEPLEDLEPTPPYEPPPPAEGP